MTDLESYRNQRDTLLESIVETLEKDDRFAAAWLTGSFGRGDEDPLSDIDLTLVIANELDGELCQRLEQVSAQTSPKRLLLFSQFGTPALIHENNNNAPEGGTFTFTMYAESAIMVDWVLVPQGKANRPTDSKLLFDKIGISVLPAPEPEDLEQSKKSVTEIWAFFWMMTAITIKYSNRNDGVFVTQSIENLHHLFNEIERRLDREPWKYTRGSLSSFQPSREKQIELIRTLSKKMLKLKHRVKEFTGIEPATPVTEIETLLVLASSQSSIENPKS
jgi:predicted nucleotidyltransferase